MALSDYFKGPQHKARSAQLEAEVTDVTARNEKLETQLAGLKDRYAQLQEMAKKYGAMEAVEVQRQIAEERKTLHGLKEAVVLAESEKADVARQVKTLQSQVLVVEETLLLESFAL